ncbi:MAG TPA: hypothetical protein DCS15_03755 [Flavobacteriales bacterium]|jgi:outer membrane protein|nr:hypothetical protein [Flavobacteriales bacterium]
MKNLSLLLSVLSFVGVVALFALEFSEDEDEGNAMVSAAGSSRNMSNASLDDARIIFVNTDSLWQQFELYGQYLDDLMKERTALEKQYEKRMRRFEADVKKFQEKAPYMSQQLGAQEQNRILGEEKSLLQMQEDMGQQLAESEMAKNTEIREKILAKIKEYNEDGRYDFVLGYSAISPVLYANDSLDVTSELLEMLNTDFSDSKVSK